MFKVKCDLVQNPIFLLLVVFIAFFLNLGGVPLFDLDEGAFAEATREMLVTSNFSATYLDGQPRYDKPIFSYWMQAISISIFGLNEWAVRLPSALAGSLWLLAGYRFAKEQWDESSARYFVAAMSLILWVMIIARAGTADAWLNLFVSLTLFNMWRFSQNPSRILLLSVYFWMALGLLTKGPVAALIPLLTGVIAFALQGKLTLFFRALVNPLGWIVLLVVVSPWLIMVYQEQGLGFFHGFIFEHNLNRFSQTKEQHGGQLYYYFILLPVILLPFSSALFALIYRIKTYWKKPLEQFLLIWFLVVLTLVSLSKTQLPHYVLYGLPGIVLIIAHHRTELLRHIAGLAFPLIFIFICAILPLLFPYFVTDNLSYDMALLKQYDQFFNVRYLVCSGILLGLALSLTFLIKDSMANRTIYVGVIQSIFVFTLLIEAIAGLQQLPVYNAALHKNPQNKPIIAYQIRMPSFSVYREQVTPTRSPQIGDRVFTKIDKIAELKLAIADLTPVAELQVVFKQGGIVLVDINFAQSAFRMSTSAVPTTLFSTFKSRQLMPLGDKN
ncbi:glycosyltransferase family 39 protein [Psychrosphaera sp. 1_MG-2023]|uniref:ArnT family glycosyltransferase n=1 Tax=Psychrosphaera sp. 1_MG-2023 TaxID=3062643 RepID=UPI0026E1FF72|nr:glycosyltransferase family 39 protein [Psychrosphaera sp. 1_MG-2023]MDO6719164.1 glycosyltransferase family 39 protein [Psychrosphaera sp. 1_MG-2023]